MNEHIVALGAFAAFLYLAGKLGLLLLIVMCVGLMYCSKDVANGGDSVTRRSRRGNKSKVIPPSITKMRKAKDGEELYTGSQNPLGESPIYIFYSSLTGASKRVALQLYDTLNASLGAPLSLVVKLLSLDDDVEDLDDYFLNVPKLDKPPIYLLVLPSYESDSPIDYFLEMLRETSTDFRVDKYPLRALAGYAVLGLGDSESWPELFCYQGKLADKWLSKLGGRRVFPFGELCVKSNLQRNEKRVNLVDKKKMFAFYGINSHRCMETTPSLSCSNKCVFCWRHGTNPVGTTWRWEVDKPDMILNGALEGHYKKIKQMRGVPGILIDRFNEAFKVRHCALSLVGEPIFYPYINQFLEMLHDKEISSFLVCNAQHPDQLSTLGKVTQLYVSIDAPTKEELKVVDRPLFRDYWDRLERCLDILRTVQSHQRTVFRLTLVKGFNMSDESVGGYADLVERGLPALIEIKGATFCGSSEGNGNPLTMQNIPFYEECVKFVKRVNEELNNRGLEYGLACEHAHSCCFLIASKKFLVDDKWYTHIDYERFFELLKSGESFDKMDYISETPEWAYFGSEQGGFNPDDTRWNRKEEKLKKKAERERVAATATAIARGETATATTAVDVVVDGPN
ncbi:S-adenosyl-L-methionine-dependent tRNA 4-demethylwyosine synthase [Pichia kudriavzevii]|uniref:tRNA 4-demethylwyosine synthase (AdoMet-dependent) n=1 Tax=Pichia kudriavzevii TaxID=4909 RepID=A0A1V2LUD3_PICKU|nr:S-adenosyl-L-methionine-dependent tRNA 4-demethylwyosine synthase [Pichia kudriavzevii]